MEIVLLILAGVVVYYLYITLQEYLKNPISVETQDVKIKPEEYDLSQDPYVRANPLDKIKKTEFGIMASIIAKVDFNNVSKPLMQEVLIDGLFEEMSSQMQGVENAKEKLKEIFNSKDLEGMDSLCKNFLQVTYGEYKKRLKFVEFLFAIAYADGKLDEDEKEKIIDIAAFLELGNDDFNKIYDDFEIQNQTEIAMEYSDALGVFEIQEDFDKQVLTQKFKESILITKQNILDVKNLNKSFATESFPELQKIQIAYDVLIKGEKNNS